MLTALIAIAAASIAGNHQVAGERYYGGPRGLPSVTITDERAAPVLDPIQADISRLTGTRADVRSVVIFNESGRPGSTFCGTVSYDGGPWISFIMRTPPRPLVEPIISVVEPDEVALWRSVGCDQDGGLHVERSL